MSKPYPDGQARNDRKSKKKIPAELLLGI
jgi:hypothetical protein